MSFEKQHGIQAHGGAGLHSWPTSNKWFVVVSTTTKQKIVVIWDSVKTFSSSEY